MVTPFSCPSCGAASEGERCARCGTQFLISSGTDMLSVDAPGLAFDGTDATATPAPPKRSAAAYLSLEPSETAVLHAASRIFAGYLASGVVTEANEEELSDRSVRLATRMALVIEKYVQSDGEDW
jgi:hypothetical protein